MPQLQQGKGSDLRDVLAAATESVRHVLVGVIVNYGPHHQLLNFWQALQSLKRGPRLVASDTQKTIGVLKRYGTAAFLFSAQVLHSPLQHGINFPGGCVAVGLEQLPDLVGA